MARPQGHGNPAWTRDETILALDLYFDLEGVIPSGRDQRVIDLSNLLRSMPYHAEEARRQTFRNPDGVAFKLQNLRQVATGRGLGNVSRTDREVWADYADKPGEVKQVATSIRKAIDLDEGTNNANTTEEEFSEGRLLTSQHSRRERNPKLRRQLLDARWPAGLSCDVCGLRRPQMRPELQEALFEGHHLLPLAEAAGQRTTRSDMALLCACCHRVLHTAIRNQKRWIGIAEAKALSWTSGTAPNAPC